MVPLVLLTPRSRLLHSDGWNTMTFEAETTKKSFYWHEWKSFVGQISSSSIGSEKWNLVIQDLIRFYWLFYAFYSTLECVWVVFSSFFCWLLLISEVTWIFIIIIFFTISSFLDCFIGFNISLTHFDLSFNEYLMSSCFYQKGTKKPLDLCPVLMWLAFYLSPHQF